MKKFEVFYNAKEIETGKEVLVSKKDYDELGNKAAQSLKDMGIEVNTSRIVEKEVENLFDKYDCWDAIGGDWEG